MEVGDLVILQYIGVDLKEKIEKGWDCESFHKTLDCSRLGVAVMKHGACENNCKRSKNVLDFFRQSVIL